MSVNASAKNRATWTHDEWYKHAKNLHDNLDYLEKRINNHHVEPVEAHILGASWRIVSASITDLDHALFSETIDPKDIKNLVQRLDQRALEVASLAQSVLKEPLFRSRL